MKTGSLGKVLGKLDLFTGLGDEVGFFEASQAPDLAAIEGELRAVEAPLVFARGAECLRSFGMTLGVREGQMHVEAAIDSHTSPGVFLTANVRGIKVLILSHLLLLCEISIRSQNIRKTLACQSSRVIIIDAMIQNKKSAFLAVGVVLLLLLGAVLVMKNTPGPGEQKMLAAAFEKMNSAQSGSFHVYGYFSVPAKHPLLALLQGPDAKARFDFDISNSYDRSNSTGQTPSRSIIQLRVPDTKDSDKASMVIENQVIGTKQFTKVNVIKLPPALDGLRSGAGFNRWLSSEAPPSDSLSKGPVQEIFSKGIFSIKKKLDPVVIDGVSLKAYSVRMDRAKMEEFMGSFQKTFAEALKGQADLSAMKQLVAILADDEISLRVTPAGEIHSLRIKSAGAGETTYDFLIAYAPLSAPLKLVEPAESMPLKSILDANKQGATDAPQKPQAGPVVNP